MIRTTEKHENNIDWIIMYEGMKREEKNFLNCLLNNMWNSWVVVLLLIFDSHFKLSCKEKNNKFDLPKYSNMILTWFIITIYKKLSKPIIKCLDISASLYNNLKSYNKCKITFPHILWKKKHNVPYFVFFSRKQSWYNRKSHASPHYMKRLKYEQNAFSYWVQPQRRI